MGKLHMQWKPTFSYGKPNLEISIAHSRIFRFSPFTPASHQIPSSLSPQKLFNIPTCSKTIFHHQFWTTSNQPCSKITTLTVFLPVAPNLDSAKIGIQMFAAQEFSKKTLFKNKHSNVLKNDFSPAILNDLQPTLFKNHDVCGCTCRPLFSVVFTVKFLSKMISLWTRYCVVNSCLALMLEIGNPRWKKELCFCWEHDVL